MPFVNRIDAGQQLARRLQSLALAGDVVVVALPRGGVPVAAEVARALAAPLDVLLVRKLGAPFQPELAMGAVGEGGVQIANNEVLRAAGVTRQQWDAVVARERVELERRAQQFRGSRGPVPLDGRTAVIVDDGIATGSTALAACRVAREHGAERIVLAVPVASRTSLDALRSAADEIVCLESPPVFNAVGEWYDDFSQTTDEEVVAILDQARLRRGPLAASSTDVTIPVDSVDLAGRLTLPEGASAVVAFAHGSGSSRHSPRNQFVASVLNQAGLGTLLFDLLTPAEEGDRGNVFDIALLGHRLVGVTRWLRANPRTRDLTVGYFGASTGAAAALWAAATEGLAVGAVVSRGGRPDLAGPRLAVVRAPTLLIVGSRDDQVLALNRQAAAQLRCEHDLAVVPGATHLFEEPGTLQLAAELARDWFRHHLLAEPPVPDPSGHPSLSPAGGT